MFSDKFSMLVK